MSKEITSDWTTFKSLITPKNLTVQYIDRGKFYEIFSLDGQILFSTAVIKTDPENTDQQDFESNYKNLNTTNKPSIQRIVEGSEKRVTEIVNSTLTYEGRSEDLDAAISDPKWQICRIYKISNNVFTEYADSGKFTQVWDNRNELFPTVPFENQNSLSFDGVDEHIFLNNNYNFGPATAFSISIWAKPNNTEAHRKFISKTTNDTQVNGWSIGHDNVGRIFMQFRSGGAGLNLLSVNSIAPAEWNHILVTYSGSGNASGVKVYINGSLDPQSYAGNMPNWTTGEELVIGSRGNTQYFSGNLNNISVFNKELSTNELSEVYNSGSPNNLFSLSTAGNLLSWWKLNSSVNFPFELDSTISRVDGILTNMEEDDYIGDVP